MSLNHHTWLALLHEGVECTPQGPFQGVVWWWPQGPWRALLWCSELCGGCWSLRLQTASAVLHLYSWCVLPGVSHRPLAGVHPGTCSGVVQSTMPIWAGSVLVVCVFDRNMWIGVSVVHLLMYDGCTICCHSCSGMARSHWSTAGDHTAMGSCMGKYNLASVVLHGGDDVYRVLMTPCCRSAPT
jgi:hypothetical protein